MTGYNIVRPGDILVYTRTVFTVGDKSYSKGDKLEILAVTDKAPHGFKSNICNFVVKCKHYPNGSVWSSIWYAIEQGWLVKEENYNEHS